MNVKIVNLKQDLDWISAMEKTKDKGGLPTNKQLDEVVMNDEEQREKLSGEGYFSCWSSTVYVYPEKNGVFKKGEDVEDKYVYQGRHMVFLSKDIPEEALGKKGISLVVQPDIDNIEKTEDKIIIHPKEVMVLKDSLQSSGWGKVDEETRISIEVDKKQLNKLEDNQKRYLYRESYGAVRPLWRGFDFGGRRDVDADVGFGYRLGVGFVEPSSREAKRAVSITETKSITINGIEKKELDLLVSNSEKELETLSKTIKPELIKSTKELLLLLGKD